MGERPARSRRVTRAMAIRVFSGIVLAQAPPDNGGFSLERLVMPGPVIEGHAETETDCRSCHAPFDKMAQRALCLDCHEAVGTDIARHQGYHGRIADITTTECRQCHTDHTGRDADIILFDEGTFDHERTDFLLFGAHVDLSCGSCHDSDAKHRDAPASCVDCHRADDPHRGRLGASCADCHEETQWSTARYDHGATNFPLRGAHEKTPCSLCHPDETYADTPQDCFSCHSLNDVHGGRHGRKCEDCHSTTSWEEQTFDHDRDTEFALDGEHASIPCTDCHAANVREDELPTDCHGCHEQDDVHKGRHGARCESCHDAEDWSRVDFDHDRDTTFPLREAHVQVTCDSCHRGNVYEEKPAHDCGTCHALDDVHAGGLGRDCERCHGEKSWRETRFDHGLTRFPLVGMHVVAPCERCHVSADYEAVSVACLECHDEEDAHEARLGPDCGLCHNPNGWTRWVFDHDVRTDYPLQGRHAGLDCLACHTEPVQNAHYEKAGITLSSTCYSCHADNDVHRGGFGRLCDRCHVTEGFGQIDAR